MGINAPLGVAASGLPPTGDQANAVLSGSFSAAGVSLPFQVAGPMNLAIYAGLVDALTVTAGSVAASAATGTGLANGAAVNSTLAPAGATIQALSGANFNLVIPPITLYGKPRPASSEIRGLYSTAGLIGATVTGPYIPANTTVLSISQPLISVIGANGSPTQDARILLSAAPTSGTNNDAFLPYVFQRTGNAILTSGTDAAALFTGAGILYSGSVQLERSFDGGSTWVVAGIGGDGTMAIYNTGTPVSAAFGEPERGVLYRLNCTSWASGTIYYRISATGGAALSLAVPQLA